MWSRSRDRHPWRSPARQIPGRPPESRQRGGPALDELAAVVRDFQAAPAQVGAWLRGLEDDGRLPPAELERARRLVVTLAGSAFAAEAFGAPSDGATGGLPAGIRDGDPVRAGVTARLVAELTPLLGLRRDSVTVHADDESASRTASRGARGLTEGGRVYLDPRRYNPRAASGRALLAHELTHVAQRERAGAVAEAAAVVPRSSLAEAEAHRTAAAFAAGGAVRAPEAALGTTQLAADDGRGPARPTYPVARDAFRGVQLYYIAEPSIPSHDLCGIDSVRGQFYELVPYLRRDGSIVAYAAWNPEVKRSEFLVGPGELQRFLDRESVLRGVAGIAYPLTGGAPRPHEAQAAILQQRILEGDAAGAFEAWKRSWAEAVRDPSWWFQVVLSVLAGASVGGRGAAGKPGGVRPAGKPPVTEAPAVKPPAVEPPAAKPPARGYKPGQRSDQLLAKDKFKPSTVQVTNWSKPVTKAEIPALRQKFLGDGAVKVGPGKWRSLDGRRQFRVKPDDYLGRHGIGQPPVEAPHVHLEFLKPKASGSGFVVEKNVHVPIVGE